MSKRKAIPPGAVVTPTASGEVVDQLPPRKADNYWKTDINALPPDEQLPAIQSRIKFVREHPDTAAKHRIEAALQAAHLDHAVCNSPELSKFVWLMRELLSRHRPGEQLEHLLAPLQTLLARHGGGRPTNEKIWQEWEDAVEGKKKSGRVQTMQEIYEDVAAKWSSGKPKNVTWKTVRNGLSKLRKLKNLQK